MWLSAGTIIGIYQSLPTCLILKLVMKGICAVDALTNKALSTDIVALPPTQIRTVGTKAKPVRSAIKMRMLHTTWAIKLGVN